MEQHQTAVQAEDAGAFLWQMVGMGLLSFGGMIMVMLLAYTRDLSMIAHSPDAIWRFVCGAPTDGSLIVPLMTSLGVVTLLGGLGALVLGRKH